MFAMHSNMGGTQDIRHKTQLVLLTEDRAACNDLRVYEL